jgi:hypothetical protein
VIEVGNRLGRFDFMAKRHEMMQDVGYNKKLVIIKNMKN